MDKPCRGVRGSSSIPLALGANYPALSALVSTSVTCQLTRSTYAKLEVEFLKNLYRLKWSETQVRGIFCKFIRPMYLKIKSGIPINPRNTHVNLAANVVVFFMIRGP